MKAQVHKEMDRKFQIRIKDWLKTESDAEKRRQRESEREKDLSKEQRRALLRDLEYSTDEEAERHKTPAAKKRLEERKLARIKEQ